MVAADAMPTLSPESPAALAAILRECSARAERVALDGNSSKRAMGGRVAGPATRVTTASIRGILEYEPRDLTVSVAAGTPWRELVAALAEHRQMLPLDPPCAETATAGGVIAANVSGPRRRLYGAARDMVIGMTLATLDGELVRTGGMVVKNVAGLDTQKALIGSYGTLAAIASVNFKLAPMPAESRTYLLAYDSAREAIAARDRILASVLQPAAVDLLNPAAAAQCGFAGYVVAVQAGASAAVLARYDRELDGATKLDGEQENAFWSNVREFAPRWIDAHAAGSIVRAGHALSDLGGVLASSPGPCVARAGSGVAYLAFADAPELRAWFEATARQPWSRIVEWSAAPLAEGLEAWPDPGEDYAVMQRLKAMFDPQALLNPGRLYGRL
jgi:glycolate oxidase FAD binding subunit